MKLKTLKLEVRGVEEKMSKKTGNPYLLVRVEDEEGHHVEHHAEANAQTHATQVRVEAVHAMLKGIDKQSRYQHRKGVVSEDTPIGKRASGEGPFDKSVE